MKNIVTFVLRTLGSLPMFSAGSCFVMLLALAIHAAAESFEIVKLNGPLATGRVFDGPSLARVTPEGTRVVYLAQQDNDGQRELFSAPVGGGAPAVKLNGRLFNQFAQIRDFALTLDGSRAIYIAAQDSSNELWSVPVAGGVSTRLNGDFTVTFGNVRQFRVSPDGQRVAYRAVQENEGVDELFSVPVTGGAAVKLNSALPDGAKVLEQFEFSADSAHVVYIADQEERRKMEIYSARADGSGSPVKLNHALSPGENVENFAAGAAGVGRVAYVARAFYSVPADGSSAAVELSATEPTEFRFTPDGGEIVFGGDQFGLRRLSSVPENGGPVVPLVEVLGTGNIKAWEITSESQRVIYLADADVGAKEELFSVPVAGGEITKLNRALPGDGPFGADVEAFTISPNGRTILFSADMDVQDRTELYAVPAAGGEPRKLNPVFSESRNYSLNPDFGFSADGSRVLYIADAETEGKPELFSVPFAGGPAIKLNGDLPNGEPPFIGGVFEISGVADDRVLYVANQDNALEASLYTVPADGGKPQKLSVPVTATLGDVTSADLTPDGKRVVFAARAAEGEAVFSVSPDGSQRILIDGANRSIDIENVVPVLAPDGSHVLYRANEPDPAVPGQNRVGLFNSSTSEPSPTLLQELPFSTRGPAVDAFRFSPDLSHVIYHTGPLRPPTPRVGELFSVPSAGGESVKLHPELADEALVAPIFEISPDGSRVVFIGDVETLRVPELFSVPIQGGVPPTKLSGPIAEGGGVTAQFRITPDSQTVIYVAEQDSAKNTELYRVPIAGGQPFKLSGNLFAGGDVKTFGPDDLQITPDGSRAIFSGAQNSGIDLVEIWSVPVNGSTPPIKISAPLAPGGDAQNFKMSPDGTRVVYRAPHADRNVFDLFSAAVDGSSPAVRISAVEHNVRNLYEISADSTNVVYIGRTPDTDNAFSAPIDGSKAPVQLNEALVEGGNVELVRIRPDGNEAVYVADQDTAGLAEIYSVPLSGGTPVKINPDLGERSRNLGVPFLEFTLDSSAVIYIFDQDKTGVNELYAAFYPGENGTKSGVQIVDITRNGDGTVTVTWTSEPGQRYSVTSSQNLRNWSNLKTGIDAQGDTTSFTDPLALLFNKKYYRVVVSGP